MIWIKKKRNKQGLKFDSKLFFLDKFIFLTNFMYLKEKIIVKLKDEDALKWRHISMNYVQWFQLVIHYKENLIS